MSKMMKAFGLGAAVMMAFAFTSVPADAQASMKKINCLNKCTAKALKCTKKAGDNASKALKCSTKALKCQQKCG